ncbi:MAG: hypothetical protein KDC38_05500 [Planctomycetes bacterium]|nr:hypothetical protein [Planctomycetota bacterium]
MSWILILLLASTSGRESSETSDPLLELLRKNGTISSAEYDQILAERVTSGHETSAHLQMSLDSGGLRAATGDGRFEFRIRGRLHWQFAHYEEDESELGDGTTLRRARVELWTTFEEHWRSVFQIGLDEGRSSLKTAMVLYDGLSTRDLPIEVLVGQYKEPFSISWQSSSNRLPALERSYVATLSPSRALGLGLQSHGDHWLAAAGLFGESVPDDADDEHDEGYAVTARAALVPICDEQNVVHFGLSGSLRSIQNDRTVRIAAAPETGVADLEFLDTGSLDGTRSVGRVGGEVAIRRGSVLLVAEWIGLQATRPRRGADPFFQAHDVTVAWIVTGEVREYRASRGLFLDFVPRSRFGAFEIVARYSHLDLNDHGVRGGSATDWMIGVNWYANENVRARLSTTFVDLDQRADAAGTVPGRQTPQIFEVQVQLSF